VTNFTRIRIIIRAVFVIVLGVITVLFWPFPSKFVAPAMTASPSYDASIAALQKMVAETPDTIREDARPQFLVHGAPTERVYVLLHGLSNNPRQYAKFSQELFQRGANVVIPRMKYHGEKNRMATDWARLTAQDMVDEAVEAIRIARGLGKHVTVIGLSVNGTALGWVAQHTDAADKVVLLSPFIAPAGVPAFAVTPLARILLGLPNFFLWWDFRAKENVAGPDYVYPRFPTHVIGETMRLGSVILQDSAQTAPRSPSILVVTSASDVAVNNSLTERLVEQWRSRGGKVEAYQFPAEEKVTHDFIDPNQPDARIDLVYPRLIELLEK
jgi:carboxylesterase